MEKALELVLERLENWFEIFARNIPNLIVAIVVAIVSFFLAKLVARVCRNLFRKLTPHSVIIDLSAKIAFFLTLLIGLFIALGVLNLDKTVTSLLAGAGVVGLALGFAFQEIASNFVAGVLIALKEPFRMGDIVEIDGILGTITAMALRTTSITTFDGNEFLIPNKKMFTEPLKNYTTTPRRRLDVEVGVAYDTDLNRAVEILKDVLSKLEGRIQEEPIGVFLKEFADSSINIETQTWIHYPADNNYLRMRHEAILRIKQGFDDAGIEIPFPMRTISITRPMAGKVKSTEKDLMVRQPELNN